MFTPLALFQAQATHESANCASAPHRNGLARNGSSWHLQTSTSAQKRANSANIMTDLHYTIMWYRVIVLKRSLQTMLARSMQSTGMGVRGQGACEHQWIKTTSSLRSCVSISTSPMSIWIMSSIRMLSNKFFVEASKRERGLMDNKPCQKHAPIASHVLQSKNENPRLQRDNKMLLTFNIDD